jgi:O-antigen/teichoic acid export membrane protein
MSLFYGLIRHRRKVSVIVVGQVLSSVGALVGVRLLTEFISPVVFGEYKLLLSGVSLAIGILVRPMSQFAMREYHDALITKDQEAFMSSMRRLFAKYILVIIVFLGVILFIFPPIQSIGVLVVVCTLGILALMVSIGFERAMLVSKDKQISATIVSLAQKWCVPLVIIFVLWFFHESVLLMLVGTVLTLAVIWCCTKIFIIKNTGTVALHRDKYSQSDLIAGAFKYGWPLAIVGSLCWMVNESDRFFLAYFHSNEVVGIYAAAYGLVSAPFVVVAGTIAQFAYPRIFRNCAGNKRGDKSVNKILVVNLLTCLLGVATVVIFKDLIAWIGLGTQYREGATDLLVWIALGYGCFAVATTFELMAFGNKRTSDMFISYGVASIVNVVFNIILIPDYAALGAAIATMLALMSYLICMTLLFYKRAYRLT